MNKIELPPFPALLDSTMLSSFDGCGERFKYSFIHKIASLGISPDLHAGGAFSRGLEAARKHYYGNGKSPIEAITFGMRALITFWGEFDPPHGHNKTLENTLAAFDAYFKEWPLESDEWRPVMLSTGPCVEFTFSIPTEVRHPTTGDPILFGGRCDMVAQHVDTGLIGGMDEKTMGKTPGQQWTKSLPMRGQFLGYTYALRQHGFDASLFIARGVGILKTKTTFLQDVEQYSNVQLEKWWYNINNKIRRMVRAYESGEFELSFGDACSSYNGCEFLQLCQTHNPEDYMGFYQHRQWDPLQKDPTWPKEGPVYEQVTLEGLKIR